MERAGSKGNGRHLEIGLKTPFSEPESRVKPLLNKPAVTTEIKRRQAGFQAFLDGQTSRQYFVDNGNLRFSRCPIRIDEASRRAIIVSVFVRGWKLDICLPLSDVEAIVYESPRIR
jgi:hypothetical protein